MKIEIAFKDFKLQSLNALPVGKRIQRISLGIKKGMDYPRGKVGKFILSQFGTIHLVSPLLPESIVTTNYALCNEARELLGEMYESCGKEAPKVACGSRVIPGSSFEKSRRLERNGVVIPFSGGKDGAHHYLKSMKSGLTPRLVHIRNMNLASTSEEFAWAGKLSSFLEEDLDIIHLHNGVPKNGFDTMRFRDMFLVALMIPYNLKYGAEKTIIEGFADELEGNMELFSGKESEMKKFNELLNDLGFPIKISWYNMPEWRVLKWLILNHPDVLANTNSCFAYPLLKLQQKDRVKELFPGFPFFESQCGMCFKCFIVNLARIAFDDVDCPAEILRRYVITADAWLAKKIKNLGAYYNDPSFSRLLALTKQKIQTVQPPTKGPAVLVFGRAPEILLLRPGGIPC